jgi:DnaJ family protein C protein 2
LWGKNIAFEILTNEENRLLFDSVDEFSGIDETVPAVLKEDKAHKFYDTFGPVLENNSRFLVNREKLPPFGDDSTPYAEVEAYYAFWYNTESWRAFGYFDEENPDKAEDREEKRYLMKKNKAARKKAKTEDNMRMQRLVDNAYASDPRIRRHKQGIKDTKAAAAAAKAQEKEAAEKAAKEAVRAAEEAKAAAALAEKEDSKAANERGRNVRRAFTKTCKRANLVADGVCTEDDIENLRSIRPLDEIEELATYAKDALVAAFKTLLADPKGPRLPSQKQV